MYFNQLELKRIEGVNELSFMIKNLIQKNCRKINHHIRCYDWKDNPRNKNYKNLILYVPEKAYEFRIKKSFLTDLNKFEKKIVKFIRKTLAF